MKRPKYPPRELPDAEFVCEFICDPPAAPAVVAESEVVGSPADELVDCGTVVESVAEVDGCAEAGLVELSGAETVGAADEGSCVCDAAGTSVGDCVWAGAEGASAAV